MSRLPVLVVLPLALLPQADAQEKKKKDKIPDPKILYAVPLVARPGEKQMLALRGKNLDAVKEVRVGGVEDATVKVLGAKKVMVPNNFPGERVGDSEVEIELDLPRGVKTGEVKLVAVRDGTDSPAYALLVRDDLPAVAEKEPNDGFDTAQPITLPCAVEGTIKNERDPDVFRFEGKKGDKLRVEVQAARFGSPLDALVSLYDANRRLVEQADDTAGSPDPVLAVTLPRDGAYFLSVIDAHDLGGPNFGYRLVVKEEE
jgi:hypothetical protein